MTGLLPAEAVKIALVLLLSFFIGFEREEHKQAGAPWAFGGVRTFPLIGLVSYALALLSAPELMPWALGLGVVGGLMMLSYHHKLTTTDQTGITTEITGLATYLIGGLVHREQYWIAATLAVVGVLLLELKKGLEGLTKRIAPHEVVTVANFLLLTVVILPIVPNRDFSRFELNPFKTWLVVVAVCGVSFGSYVLQRLLKGRGGVLWTAMLGGAYSSTVTTVALAKQAHGRDRPMLYAGSILSASGVMYARQVALVALFNRGLASALAPGFLTLSLLGLGVGLTIARRDRQSVAEPERPTANPLELQAAFLFAALFVVVLVLTSLARQYLGSAGLYGLAALMGVTDVDPFILGLAQPRVEPLPLHLAAIAITLAAASNNLVKAAYARFFGGAATGTRSMVLLLALAGLGLLPLLWL